MTRCSDQQPPILWKVTQTTTPPYIDRRAANQTQQNAASEAQE